MKVNKKLLARLARFAPRWAGMIGGTGRINIYHGPGDISLNNPSACIVAEGYGMTAEYDNPKTGLYCRTCAKYSLELYSYVAHERRFKRRLKLFVEHFEAEHPNLIKGYAA